MRQPWNEFNSKMPWRMELGCYALNKLACGGLVFGLLWLYCYLTEEITGLPVTIAGNSGELTAQLWAYGFALPAALAADALYDLLPWLRKPEQFTLYLAVGFSVFLLLGSLMSSAGTGILWSNGMAGAGITLLYYGGRHWLNREYGVQIILAFLLPLLLWIIGLQ
ncbi:hypothetical protein L8C07_26035 [Paenibacillus sp. CMAA1739]|uniref:hypothetical protein n=1 Tax=Paenibacillus ottowii TaxID=2315729 RepID=UPI00272F8997|nr:MULTISPECIES: hypothetical protein [Paenibacillus]MDP1513124.1 hypothetical protein [Paenibacillus ottowii]MEC4569408.1 hypothetical protein [Paenibacillus sp. CMAA1739]